MSGMKFQCSQQQMPCLNSRRFGARLNTSSTIASNFATSLGKASMPHIGGNG